MRFPARCGQHAPHLHESELGDDRECPEGPSTQAAAIFMSRRLPLVDVHVKMGGPSLYGFEGKPTGQPPFWGFPEQKTPTNWICRPKKRAVSLLIAGHSSFAMPTGIGGHTFLDVKGTVCQSCFVAGSRPLSPTDSRIMNFASLIGSGNRGRNGWGSIFQITQPIRLSGEVQMDPFWETRDQQEAFVLKPTVQPWLHLAGDFFAVKGHAKPHPKG